MGRARWARVRVGLHRDRAVRPRPLGTASARKHHRDRPRAPLPRLDGLALRRLEPGGTRSAVGDAARADEPAVRTCIAEPARARRLRQALLRAPRGSRPLARARLDLDALRVAALHLHAGARDELGLPRRLPALALVRTASRR